MLKTNMHKLGLKL